MTDPILEHECPMCHGKRHVNEPETHYLRPCPACEGTGVALTEYGEQLIKFLKRHVKLEIKGT